MDDAPLIVTAELPADVLTWADALRRAHFPPERNHLVAHVTLFHALPGALLAEVSAALAEETAQLAPPRARITGLMSLGGGTALRIECGPLDRIRRAIAARFSSALTAQDRSKRTLHITIQNKVTSAAAKALQAALGAVERDLSFEGLALHRYIGPTWEPIARWPFSTVP